MIKKLSQFSPIEGLIFLASEFPEQVVFTTSFGQEDQIITDMIAQNQLPISVVSLDTGRLFQETYELMDKTKIHYKIPIKFYFPNTQSVENLINTKGQNSFYESVENRKECCFIRKIEPLKRALKNKKVWITGLRAEQSDNRQTMKIWEFDENNQIYKYNPLLHWTYVQVLNYLKEYNVPDNSLHRKGFISIGCLPCTRAISVDEDPRAGRWWWEISKKECGLHR